MHKQPAYYHNFFVYYNWGASWEEEVLYEALQALLHRRLWAIDAKPFGYWRHEKMVIIGTLHKSVALPNTRHVQIVDFKFETNSE